MKTYELYFGKEREEKEFQSFYFEPEDFYQGKLGVIFMVGTVDSSQTKKQNLLKRISWVVREEFFSHPSLSSSGSLRLSLKKANKFLRGVVEQGDAGWLSSFGFAIVSLREEKKEKEVEKYSLNFTKVGRVRIKLLRQGEVIDLGEKVKRKEIEPYPLTFFSNVVSGKLRQGDRLALLSSGLYHHFLEKKSLSALSSLSFLSPQKINRVLSGSSEKVEGVCALVTTEREGKSKKKRLVFKKEAKRRIDFVSPFKEKVVSFLPAFSFLSVLGKIPNRLCAALRLRKIPEMLGIDLPSFSKRKAGLVLLFLILVIGGRVVAGMERRKKIDRLEMELQKVEEKRKKAHLFLSAGQEQKARNEYLEAWKRAVRLSKRRTPVYLGIEKKKDQIRKELLKANKLQNKRPELFFQFDKKDFLPQNMVLGKKGLYFTTPYRQKTALLDRNKKLSFFATRKNLWEGAFLQELGGVAFLGEKDVFLLEGKKLSPLSLQGFEQKDGSSLFASFLSNFYVGKGGTGKAQAIAKYPYKGGLEWGFSRNWLKKEVTLERGAKSMAIDGGIWILYKNRLDYYFGGELEKSVSLARIFPPVSAPDVLHTKSKAALYITEPARKRIIVLDKKAGLRAQYQSQDFKNLKDIALSLGGKYLFILSGSRVYRLKM